MADWTIILKYVNPQVIGLLAAVFWLLKQLDKSNDALRGALDSNAKIVVMLDTVLYELRNPK